MPRIAPPESCNIYTPPLLADAIVTALSGKRHHRWLEPCVGQGAFRSAVLQLWNYRCAVTGSSILDAIRASHIKPWRDSKNEERLDPANGLPLVASLDALFDAGLISFEDSVRLLVSSELSRPEQEIYGVAGKMLMKKPPDKTASYLHYHRTTLYRK